MGSTGSKLIFLRGILRPPPLRLTAFLACAVISLSAAGALPVLADTTTPAFDLRQTARDYFVSADYGKAIETYSTLLSQQPTDALLIASAAVNTHLTSQSQANSAAEAAGQLGLPSSKEEQRPESTTTT